MEREDLSGKVAVVTGGSRGIGKHIARSIVRAGAHVAISGRHEDSLREAAGEFGERCRPYQADQRDPGSIAAFAEQVAADFGPIDLLVNNAAHAHMAPVVDFPLEQWNAVIETNLTGVFLTTQAFLPGMIKKNRGDIFMISSMSGKKGDPNASAYAASKFGLQGFSQALTYEVRKHNIRVMVLNPSHVNKGPDDGPAYGQGEHLHAADLGDAIVHLACMPGRTLFRDMDIWGTNP
jgi:3-oxoacyl-[acyl-carrier protein] reductase